MLGLGSFSAFHSRFFFIAIDVSQSIEFDNIRNEKKSSVQVGLQIQHKTREVYNHKVCHSIGNLTKWFDEVNLSRLDSSGMTKILEDYLVLAERKRLCEP